MLLADYWQTSRHSNQAPIAAFTHAAYWNNVIVAMEQAFELTV